MGTVTKLLISAWRHLVIEGADAKTFRPIDEYYSVDDKHIFRENKLFSSADHSSSRVDSIRKLIR